MIRGARERIVVHLEQIGWLADRARWLAGEEMTRADLIAAAGPEQARTLVDWLEVENRQPRLLKNLAEGYVQTDKAPDIASAALLGVRPLAPELSPTIDYYKALVHLQRAKLAGPETAGHLEKAWQLLAKARLAGLDTPGLLQNEARVLKKLGALPKALQGWERALERDPQSSWAWGKYSADLLLADKPREALEAAIGALAFAKHQLSSQRLVGNMVYQFKTRHQRRHNLALLTAAVVSLKAAKADPNLLTGLQRFLEGVPWETRPRNPLEHDLQIYVWMCLGKEVTIPKQQFRPTQALALARHLLATDPEAAGSLLRAAASSESLVAHLARLDPLLADLLND